MLALEVLLAVFLLIVCGVGSGFFFVRRLRWTPMEKLCGSVGASLIICYLFFVVAYLLRPNGIGVSRIALSSFSAGSAVLIVLARRDVASLLRSVRVRQTLKGFSFLVVWTL